MRYIVGDKTTDPFCGDVQRSLQRHSNPVRRSGDVFATARLERPSNVAPQARAGVRYGGRTPYPGAVGGFAPRCPAGTTLVNGKCVATFHPPFVGGPGKPEITWRQRYCPAIGRDGLYTFVPC